MIRIRRAATVVCLVVLAAGVSSPRRSVAEPDGLDPRQTGEILAVPVTDASGTVRLQTRLCRPEGSAPARLVVIAHGSPPHASDRPRMQLGSCGQEAAQWFLHRGYAVAFMLRRGYGATGGLFAEEYGSCADPDYVHAGQETARDIQAVADSLAALPGIRPDGVVIVGQSAGGWGAMAADSLPHPKVAAFVSMAGGRGGHAHDVANQNCRPDRLAEAAGRFGATASTPMLWIYAENDSFFAPSIARTLHDSFTAAGGTAELVQLGSYDGDGHRLFFGAHGSAIWGPAVERYLASRRVYPP